MVVGCSWGIIYLISFYRSSYDYKSLDSSKSCLEYIYFLILAVLVLHDFHYPINVNSYIAFAYSVILIFSVKDVD